MIKLSLQYEKKCKRNAKASSSSFSGFLPSMLVPLCQLPSPAGTGVKPTTPSSTACAVTHAASAPALFVLPVDATLVEPGCKRCRVESPREWVEMPAAFEDIWASGRCSSPCPGPLSASQMWLVTLPVPPLAVPAPVPSPAVPVAVLVVPPAASLTRSDLFLRSTASFHSCEQSWSRPSPGPGPVPVRSLLVLPLVTHWVGDPVFCLLGVFYPLWFDSLVVRPVTGVFPPSVSFAAVAGPLVLELVGLFTFPILGFGFSLGVVAVYS